MTSTIVPDSSSDAEANFDCAQVSQRSTCPTDMVMDLTAEQDENGLTEAAASSGQALLLESKRPCRKRKALMELPLGEAPTGNDACQPSTKVPKQELKRHPANRQSSTRKAFNLDTPYAPKIPVANMQGYPAPPQKVYFPPEARNVFDLQANQFHIQHLELQAKEIDLNRANSAIDRLTAQLKDQSLAPKVWPRSAFTPMDQYNAGQGQNVGSHIGQASPKSEEVVMKWNDINALLRTVNLQCLPLQQNNTIVMAIGRFLERQGMMAFNEQFLPWVNQMAFYHIDDGTPEQPVKRHAGPRLNTMAHSLHPVAAPTNGTYMPPPFDYSQDTAPPPPVREAGPPPPVRRPFHAGNTR